LRQLWSKCLGLTIVGLGIGSLPFTVAGHQANSGDGQKAKSFASGDGARNAKLDKAKSDSATGAVKAPSTDPSVYRIGVEDDLQISVWKEPDLSINVVVRPDGMITMPLLNDISVVGLQTGELQTLLTEKLKPFVNEPQVTVVVRGIKSRKVYVYGQVNKAGAYALVGRKTVLEVLAEAGGLNVFAKKGSIYVLREANGKKTKIPFNYKSALAGKNPNDNLDLLPGDIIVVP